MMIISSYENQAMLDALKKGEILGFATQYPVCRAASPSIQAVRLFEKKPYMNIAQAIPDMIVKGNMDKINIGPGPRARQPRGRCIR